MQSKVTDSDNKEHEILCGNDKLMKRFNVQIQSEILNNIEYLEREGKTVVSFAIDGQLAIILAL